MSAIVGSLRGLAIAVAMLSAATVRAADTFPPVDEAITQPDFFLFRARLQAAVARRDVDALLREVDPQVVASFGDEPGIAAFRAMWALDTPATSPLWAELATVLALGGGFDEDGAFEAPYISSEWPDERDPFEYVAIVGSDVRARAEESADAEVVATLAGNEIVARAEDDGSVEAWTAITLPDQRIAYVDSRHARGPLDYRARFEKVDGHWRLTSFVAGD